MQKYHMGDHVLIKGIGDRPRKRKLGPNAFSYSFGAREDKEAIVEYSYADRYGGDDEKSYSVYVKGEGSQSWQLEHTLELISKNRCDLLEQWRKDAVNEKINHCDIDWIFEHGPEIVDSLPSASILILSDSLGISNEDMYGESYYAHGDLANFIMNARKLQGFAAPYLKKSDKEGWLEFAKAFKDYATAQKFLKTLTKEQRKKSTVTKTSSRGI
jgi:hypothetical protein